LHSQAEPSESVGRIVAACYPQPVMVCIGAGGAGRAGIRLEVMGVRFD
jgi:hypothetical protein